MVKKYIDISYYQGDPDFEKVKNEVDGVIIRAGYGQNNIDKKFVRNITECNRLGIPCGVYWFSYAYTEEMAHKEAQYCLDAIKPYKVELPVCFDFEYDSVENAKKQGVTITKAKATALVHAFCGVIEDAGYYAMNYTNGDYLSRYFDDTTLKYDLWLATWPKNPDPTNPPRECGIWQYGTSNINGISGVVDSNYSYKDYPVIIRNGGKNGLVPEVVKPAWYAEDMAWAMENGITDGTRPTDPATRAEIWAMLHRMSKL